MSKFRQM